MVSGRLSDCLEPRQEGQTTVIDWNMRVKSLGKKSSVGQLRETRFWWNGLSAMIRWQRCFRKRLGACCLAFEGLECLRMCQVSFLITLCNSSHEDLYRNRNGR